MAEQFVVAVDQEFDVMMLVGAETRIRRDFADGTFREGLARIQAVNFVKDSDGKYRQDVVKMTIKHIGDTR